MREQRDLKVEQGESEHIEDIWDACIDEQEVQKLIDFMVANPSQEYGVLLRRAEAGSLKFHQVLLDRADEVYSSIAEAIADSDGLVEVR